MAFTVIEGGLSAARGERPIVWNRSCDPATATLVIMDHPGGHMTIIAWDTGEAFLIGIRDIAKDRRHDSILTAWAALARGNRNEVRDERRPSEAVTLANGVADQLLVEGVAPIDRTAAGLATLERQRADRRGHAPLPQGGLFDETARNQQELF